MMKQSIGVVCLALLFASASFGQGVYLGPMVGMSFSASSVKQGDQELEIEKDGSGPLFGGFVGVRLAHILSLESGAEYARQSLTTDFGGTSIKLKNDYLNVPVMLMLEFPSQFIIKARVRAGVQFGFELGCKVETTEGGSSSSQDCENTATKSPDIGAPASLGIGVGLGELLYAFVDGGFRVGLNNVADTSLPGAEDLEIRHNAAFVKVGLSIGLGG